MCRLIRSKHIDFNQNANLIWQSKNKRWIFASSNPCFRLVLDFFFADWLVTAFPYCWLMCRLLFFSFCYCVYLFALWCLVHRLWCPGTLHPNEWRWGPHSAASIYWVADDFAEWGGPRVSMHAVSTGLLSPNSFWYPPHTSLTSEPQFSLLTPPSPPHLTTEPQFSLLPPPPPPPPYYWTTVFSLTPLPPPNCSELQFSPPPPPPPPLPLLLKQFSLLTPPPPLHYWTPDFSYSPFNSMTILSMAHDSFWIKQCFQGYVFLYAAQCYLACHK